MRLADLTPADYNPRRDLQPGDPAFEDLRRNLDAFGCVQHLVWNQRTKTLVSGHQRAKVLAALGRKTAPVVVVDLDPGRERALNLALNKISGEWDTAKLGEVLGGLDDDLVTLAGFDPAGVAGQIEALEAEQTHPREGMGVGEGDAAYRVIVECGDEAEQREAFEFLCAAGLSPRLNTLE